MRRLLVFLILILPLASGAQSLKCSQVYENPYGLVALPMLAPETGSMGVQPLAYLNAERRKAHEVFVRDGLLTWSDGSLVDTQGKNEIYVMAPDGKLYSKRPGVDDQYDFHHSSFLSGGPISGAGMFVVRDGVLIRIDNGSGHYQPPQGMLAQVIEVLKQKGLDTDADVFTYDGRKLDQIKLTPEERAYIEAARAYATSKNPELVNRLDLEERAELFEKGLAFENASRALGIAEIGQVLWQSLPKQMILDRFIRVGQPKSSYGVLLAGEKAGKISPAESLELQNDLLNAQNPKTVGEMMDSIRFNNLKIEVPGETFRRIALRSDVEWGARCRALFEAHQRGEHVGSQLPSIVHEMPEPQKGGFMEYEIGLDKNQKGMTDLTAVMIGEGVVDLDVYAALNRLSRMVLKKRVLTGEITQLRDKVRSYLLNHGVSERELRKAEDPSAIGRFLNLFRR